MLRLPAALVEAAGNRSFSACTQHNAELFRYVHGTAIGTAAWLNVILRLQWQHWPHRFDSGAARPACRETFREEGFGMSYLEIETRNGTHRVQLERDRLSIGRLSYNDVVLPFAQISRQHAELRLIDGKWWIADLHSTNGILIREQRIQEHCLSSGDRITLAPGISVRFVDNGAAASAPRQSAPSGGPELNSGSRMPQGRHPAAQQPPSSPFGVSDQVPQGRTWGPTTHVPPASSQRPFVPSTSVSPMRPRSVFSDDEVPYVPPGMEPPTPPTPISFPETGRQKSGTSVPLANVGSNPLMPSVPSAPNGPNGERAGGYPAPPGPLHAGSDPHDLFMRTAPTGERARSTSGPASKLLHVCQTCGQLTTPDAAYCQNCHHSIAHECSNCRLSLLPIQDRCPRCHTPNQLSVRRAHPGRGDV